MLDVHHPRSLSIKNNLGIILKNQGTLEEAEKAYRDIPAVEQMAPGDDGMRLLATKNDLALVFRSQRNFSEAGPVHGEELELTFAKWGRRTYVNPHKPTQSSPGVKTSG
ncbi:uncharacterized protein PV06_11402 [Exophiala oligosperma]|uniref:Uncharacterized protein n=1 Tax=Exophiala oligosperma TaxID=215243 RepID=A0A0D2BFR6_9EURO|nr:uncharacterized protein PV06_11402 [Exophiala oligosperma]KIW36352.1 hypothetical protein PV06_11402 [Exophiala oligosperma]